MLCIFLGRFLLCASSFDSNYARITFGFFLDSNLEVSFSIVFTFLSAFFIQFSRYTAVRLLLGCLPRPLPCVPAVPAARLAPGAAGGGLKWTRTLDLTLIRRAL